MLFPSDISSQQENLLHLLSRAPVYPTVFGFCHPARRRPINRRTLAIVLGMKLAAPVAAGKLVVIALTPSGREMLGRLRKRAALIAGR